MENELQYLFLEIECSTRVCAGGREGQADRGAARAANLQMTAAVQVHDTGGRDSSVPESSEALATA